MTTPLDRCGSCDKPFTLADFPQDTDNLVFTVCQNFFLHVYHNKNDCLAGWVKEAERPCPTCNSTIYSHQGGKKIKQISQVFLNSLKREETFVPDTLSESDHSVDGCIICTEVFPLIQLKFNPEDRHLYHLGCGSENLPRITVHDLSRAVSKIVKEQPHLQKYCTPTPPTRLQRFKTDHPFLYKVAIVSAISLTAFVLNRLQFEGKNSILSVVGWPAYQTLRIAQKIFARLD